MKKQMNLDKSSVGGFYRLNIVEHGKNGEQKIVGDSGWIKNQITDLGAQHYLVENLASAAGSSSVSYLALGTGTAPGATAVNLPNELTDAAGCRFTFSTSVVSSRTLQCVGTLASNIITAARTINNIGLFAVSTTGAGSIFAGNTYATSSLATNQSVNCTYQIQFP